MVNRSGWARLESDLEDEARRAVEALVTGWRQPNESVQDYADRISRLQQFVAATRNVIAIPRRAIEQEDEE